MIEFINKDSSLTHTQNISITYPRTVQITFGNFPFPDLIHNLILEIKQKVTKKDSYATNVKGGMTDWECFKNHPTTTRFINYCINLHQNSNPDLFKYFYERQDIQNAWGNEIKKGDWVNNHTHNCYHGILYLTEGNPLILPELNLQIKPKPGDYYFFPPFIQHYVNVNEKENRYNLILNIHQKPNWAKEKRLFEKSLT